MMAGWSSFNKYSLLGGLRAAAAIVSYELPLILGRHGRRAPGRHAQPEHDRGESGRLVPRLVHLPAAPRALIFFIAATAEGSRTPFDLTEADSEIVAGFATEYSGMRFGFFFFAEYVNVFILSALTATLFLGGWNGPSTSTPSSRRSASRRRSSCRSTPGALGPWLLAVLLLVPPCSSSASERCCGCCSRPGAS